MAKRNRVHLHLAVVASALVLGTQIGVAAAATETPCGPAPDGYNIIISNAVQIDGTEGDDFVCAGRAANEIHARSGNDIVHGGGGDDLIHGGKGDDILLGGPGKDRIWAGEGDDRVNGGANNDDLHGQWGSDVLHGRRGVDKLNGGTGNDRLRGGAGRDALLGGAGNDILQGNAGSDMLHGGVTRYSDKDGGRDRLDGRRGQDTCTPAARVVSCENPKPTDGNIGFTRWSYVSGDSFSFYATTDLPNNSISGGLAFITVWADERRLVPVEQFVIDGLHERSVVPVGSLSLGMVVEIIDFRDAITATMTHGIDAQATFDDPRGVGVIGMSPPGSTVTVDAYNLPLQEDTARSVSVSPTGEFHVPLPALSVDRHALVVNVVQDSGSTAKMILHPFPTPTFDITMDTGGSTVSGVGKWTPGATVSVAINGTTVGRSTVSAHGRFRIAGISGFDATGTVEQLVEVRDTGGVSASTFIGTFFIERVVEDGVSRLRGVVPVGLRVTKLHGLDVVPVQVDENGSFSIDQATGLTFYDEAGASWGFFPVCETGPCEGR